MDDRFAGGATPALTAGATAYPDYANPELLDKMPLAARVLIDVGCATGALGAAYLRRNPAARMFGIDADSAAIAVAATRLTETACIDVETAPIPFDLPDGVDCLVYGDLLEHLRDPWTLLKRQAELLRSGGTALICMPNVEHWSLAMRLLNGSFNYEESGILDRTHLRWFTPRMMGEALQQAGLELADVAPRPTDLANAQRFVQAIAPGLAAIGVEPNEYLQRAGPLQFIWRARKTPPPRIFINATMLAPLGGVSDVRVVDPLRALRTDSTALTLITAEPEFPAGPADMPKIAILHRPLLVGEAGLQRVRALLAKNYVLVTEFDDHPVFMAERGLDMSQLVTFTAVHAVQTSTPALAQVLAPQNPEIAVFPNAIAELPPIRNFTDPDQITLFFGALNRGEDWAPYMAGLNDVARRLRFVVAHDRDFFDALESPEKEFHPTCDYPTYLNLLAGCEIAFMPLADTAFNRAKSDLKFIEAAACRVVSLASDVVYGASIEPNKTGLVFTDSLDMRSHLLRVLAYPEAARRIGDAARAHVAQSRMWAYQVDARMAWYRSLWERRDALNAALRARLPALFQQPPAP
jgi:2-polyprenyl-3-methyl-5-hydroxy-6-metoxy-1,4-benzoquinol methylase